MTNMPQKYFSIQLEKMYGPGYQIKCSFDNAAIFVEALRFIRDRIVFFTCKFLSFRSVTIDYHISKDWKLSYH